MKPATTSTGPLEADLRRALRGEVEFDPHVLGLYATDASIYQIMPIGVVCPRDEADVCAAVRLAAQHDVTILPRGGGTSLAGQAVGASLVIDFSRHMNHLLELNVEQRWARVQPGLVRDELNALVAGHNLHFAPDPATATRANIGGMIANNSSGTRSILYGKTVDHLLEARVLLADGTQLEMKALDGDALAAKQRGESREAALYRGFTAIIDRNRDAIRERFPRVMRRVGGYNLDAFANGAPWNLATLFAGSEGTLGLLLDAKIKLEPLPRHTAVCVAHFTDLMEAIRAVEPLLELGPAAVEILDHVVIGKARENRSTAPLCGFIQGDPTAVLLIEFYGDSEADVARKSAAAARTLAERGFGYACPAMLDAASQKAVWTVRKKGLGLMLGVKGDRKPIPFIEDACVPVAVLPEYIERVLACCREAGCEVAMYAHASVGVIHVRPMLDLRRQDDIDRMKRIAETTLGLVMTYKGAWSGEHGDGLVRSPFNRQFFGDTVYEAFKDVKRLFDPDNRMNPGKVIEAEPMDTHLRYGTAYRVQPLKTEFHYRAEGSFASAVELCSGVGECRKTLSGTMCPSYMATRDEEHSTRGRANALRLAMTGQAGPDALTSPRLHETLDLCLSCKACKTECPSNVDMAKLKGEFLQQYYDRHGTTLRDRLIAGSPAMARRLCGPAAPLVNALMRTAPVKWLVERVAGFARERTLPAYASRPFHSRFTTSDERAAPNGTVVLFADTYMNYHEPYVGFSAVALLESCGYRVVLANAGCCQRTRISHGFLREARRDGERTLRNLDRYIREGLTVVVCEPGCASALVDDLPDLIEDAELAQRVSANVMMIDAFLAREAAAGRLTCRFESPAASLLVHGHCHQKALFGTSPMMTLLQGIPGLKVREVDSGCCGMAGSFGYEKEHYELSSKIGERRLFPAVRECDSQTTIVACGFSCRHQIEHFTGRQAVHWVEVIRGANGA